MVRIDRDQVLLRKTDRTRWSDPAAFEAAWDARAELASYFIPAGAHVLDLGCGMADAELEEALAELLAPFCMTDAIPAVAQHVLEAGQERGQLKLG